MRHGERSVYYHDSEQDRPRDCERTNWRSSVYMNCNDFHEINVPHDDAYDKRFLGGGYYRYAWLLKPRYASIPMDSFVLKMLQLPSDDDDKDHIPSSSSFFKIHHEAIIMERLSASPTIVDIYGHCATSIAAQIMPEEVTTTIVPLPGYMSQKQLDEQPTLCQNKLTLDEKLEIALTMAESMAEMHGFVGGVMVHGDIHPDQYLRDANGQVRLNDFNNAEILDWNVTNNQRYCKTDRGAWGGMYRAPEEFRGDYIDEQIDVYALGNNLYTLLTGLWPFYEHESYSVVQRKLHAKERPFIDDRYRHGHVIEQRFVHLMERCWEHTPENRPSVFQVLDALRRLKETYTRTKSEAT
ncbi:hypothetical protein MPSEU_000057200 [Mayamaea pseudoterrestris]|nr:hypothetical protein MPSEU_000057200 [Mayamaea pseudoterrestris]